MQMSFTQSLCLAAQSGSLQQLKQILPQCSAADVNGVGDEKIPPLYFATKNGHLDAVIELLNFEGINPDQDSPVGSPLLCARDLNAFSQTSSDLANIMMCLLLAGASQTHLCPAGGSIRHGATGKALSILEDYESLQLPELIEKWPVASRILRPVSGVFVVCFFDGTVHVTAYQDKTPLTPLLSAQCEARATMFCRVLVKRSNGATINVTTETMGDIDDRQLNVSLLSFGQEKKMLQDIFENPEKLEAVRRYAEERQISESFEFLEEVFNYKKMMRDRAEAIFAKYIKVGADNQINIPYPMVKAIQVRNDAKVMTSNQFDEAQDHILGLLQYDLGSLAKAAEKPFDSKQLPPSIVIASSGDRGSHIIVPKPVKPKKKKTKQKSDQFSFSDPARFTKSQTERETVGLPNLVATSGPKTSRRDPFDLSNVDVDILKPSCAPGPKFLVEFSNKDTIGIFSTQYKEKQDRQQSIHVDDDFLMDFFAHPPDLDRMLRGSQDDNAIIYTDRKSSDQSHDSSFSDLLGNDSILTGRPTKHRSSSCGQQPLGLTRSKSNFFGPQRTPFRASPEKPVTPNETVVPDQQEGFQPRSPPGSFQTAPVPFGDVSTEQSNYPASTRSPRTSVHRRPRESAAMVFSRSPVDGIPIDPQPASPPPIPTPPIPVLQISSDNQADKGPGAGGKSQGKEKKKLTPRKVTSVLRL